MGQAASAIARHCKGRIYGNRDLHCGNCDKKLSRSFGLVSQLEVVCDRCKTTNRFDEPITAPPTGYTPEQEIALKREETDSKLADAMARMVETFSDFISQRGAPRLVAA